MSKPYFDFFNYAGLQRSVYLLAVPRESVVDFDLDYAIHGKNAEVSYQVRTNGEHAVQLELLDAEGSCVAQKDGKEGVLYVENAHIYGRFVMLIFIVCVSALWMAKNSLMSMSRRSESVP